MAIRLDKPDSGRGQCFGDPLQCRIHRPGDQRDSCTYRFAAGAPSSRADRIRIDGIATTLMGSLQRSAEKMQNVRAPGVDFALDDFGTGYSCLSSLPDLPFGAIMLDRSFIRKIAPRSGSRTMIRSIADLAHSMGIRVIVEGVGGGIPTSACKASWRGRSARVPAGPPRSESRRSAPVFDEPSHFRVVRGLTNKIRVGRTYWFSRVVGEAGLEPTTPGLEGRCSIQLSYSPMSCLILTSSGSECICKCRQRSFQRPFSLG